MPEIKKLYYSIGEVSQLTGLKQYVLRYWETEFPQLRPAKNSAGNRTYKVKDLEYIYLIKDLLYSQKFTIKGALKHLSVQDDQTIKSLNRNNALDVINVDQIRADIEGIQKSLNKLKLKLK